MFKFVRLFYKRFDAEWGWYCLIENSIDLIMWYMDSGVNGKIARSLMNLISSTDLDRICENRKCGSEHINTPLGILAIAHIERMNATGEKNKWNLAELANYMNDTMIASKMEAVNKGHRIVINKNGGWFILDDNFSILETVTNDIYFFSLHILKKILTLHSGQPMDTTMQR